MKERLHSLLLPVVAIPTMFLFLFAAVYIQNNPGGWIDRAVLWLSERKGNG